MPSRHLVILHPPFILFSSSLSFLLLSVTHSIGHFEFERENKKKSSRGTMTSYVGAFGRFHRFSATPRINWFNWFNFILGVFDFKKTVLFFFLLKSLPYKSFLFPPLTVNPVFGEMNSAELATFLVFLSPATDGGQISTKRGKEKEERRRRKKRKESQTEKERRRKKIRERMKEEGGGCMRLPEPSGFLKNPAASCAWRND